MKDQGMNEEVYKQSGKCASAKLIGIFKINVASMFPIMLAYPASPTSLFKKFLQCLSTTMNYTPLSHRVLMIEQSSMLLWGSKTILKGKEGEPGVAEQIDEPLFINHMEIRCENLSPYFRSVLET